MRLKISAGIVMFLLLILAGVGTQKYLSAQESGDAARNALQKKIEEYESKLSELRNQKSTLSSQIQYMDTQIYLTGLRSEETTEKIEKTKYEIETIDDWIDDLDVSLDKLSKTLLERIIAGYKTRKSSVVDVIFDSESAADAVNKLKYYEIARESNKKVLLEVQEAKLNYEEQRKLREKKKKELDQLQITLDQQEIDLKNQQDAKKNLLEVTQNDEGVYQDLLAKAKKELAGFSAFTQAAGGGGLTSFGSGSNGWYFTQRDPSWGNTKLPGSSSSLSLAGCAVSSIAMVCKSYGQDISPASIAADTSKFIYGDLWNWAFNCSGKSQSWLYGPSQDQIKSYVNSGTPVILRLVSPSVSGLHFIVAFEWDESKGDFKIHDPYYGPDKYFTDQYSWSQITTGIVIK